MDAFEFILAFLGIIAWPMVVVIAMILFKNGEPEEQ